MKLVNSPEPLRQKIFRKYISPILFIVFFIYFINLFIKSFSFNSMSLVFSFISIGLFLIFFSLFLIPYEKYNINYQYLKSIGKLVKGNIISTGATETGLFKNYNNYLIVEYENKTQKIKYLEDNDAFCILGILLDPYPLKEEKSIPIDLYIFKNKIYADLDSVDLSASSNFSEALKILNQMNYK